MGAASSAVSVSMAVSVASVGTVTLAPLMAFSSTSRHALSEASSRGVFFTSVSPSPPTWSQVRVGLALWSRRSSTSSVLLSQQALWRAVQWCSVSSEVWSGSHFASRSNLITAVLLLVPVPVLYDAALISVCSKQTRQGTRAGPNGAGYPPCKAPHSKQ